MAFFDNHKTIIDVAHIIYVYSLNKTVNVWMMLKQHKTRGLSRPPLRKNDGKSSFL